MESEEKTTAVPKRNTHHGHALRRLRLAKGLTQKQLGELSHICQQQVSHYENEKEIEDNILKQFAKGLGVSVELIKELEEETPLVFYIENNTFDQENENSAGSKNVAINENSTNNYADKALYDALEQMQKLYEKGMQLYESSLQANNQLLQSLITSLGKQNK